MDDVFQSPKPATLPTIAPARLACGHARATAPESSCQGDAAKHSHGELRVAI